MVKSDPQHTGDKKPKGTGKKTWQKPRILSVEKLEVVAATCDGGKAAFTGADLCGTSGPISS